ncbi:MAG: hypothetical protein D6782_11795 [Alphaproteobacteria bacterium]|nr:MAG: hypothetical protein D6782_11795 [Alphaproteobacteria bacterium]
MYETANAIEDAFAGGATLAEAIERFGLQQGAAILVSRQGEQKAGGVMDALPQRKPLLDKAFDMQLGDEPMLVAMGETAYGVVELTAIEPARALAFEEVKARVAADWTAAEKRRRNEALARDLLEKARAGGDLAVLAQGAGYTVVRDVVLERQSVLQQPPSQDSAASVLFGLREGELGLAPNATRSAYMIVRNDRIVPADPSADREYWQALRAGLARVIGTDLQQQYIAAQQRKAGVEINERLWKSVREQLGAPF